MPTLASWPLTSVSSELSEAFWLRAVDNAASLLFSCVSKVLALDKAAARSPSLFLALDDRQKSDDTRQVRIESNSSPGICIKLQLRCKKDGKINQTRLTFGQTFSFVVYLLDFFHCRYTRDNQYGIMQQINLLNDSQQAFNERWRF